MSGLQSMLVPLETLPGWPAAPNPSVLEFLGVIVVIPAIIALVISVASYVASTRELRRFGPPVNPTTTFAGAPGVEGAGEEVSGGIIEAGRGAHTGTGGTSARW